MGLKVRLQEKKVPLTSLKLDGIGSTEGNASSDGSSDDPTTTTTEENTSDHGSGDDTTTTTTTEENTSNERGEILMNGVVKGPHYILHKL